MYLIFAPHAGYPGSCPGLDIPNFSFKMVGTVLVLPPNVGCNVYYGALTVTDTKRMGNVNKSYHPLEII